MNLIEQLGGYEAAKAKFRDNGSIHAERLKTTLLEYRRKHNIFEVGDKVVVVDGDYKKHYAGVYPILSMRGDYLITLLFGETVVHRVCFRHATDEEIKAGKRLEVNQ